MKHLILMDCEGHGPAPTLNDAVAFEFGAVEFDGGLSFHGIGGTKETFENFDVWLSQFSDGVIFVSDNPAYDWQFINYYFHLHLGRNPFGYSARRIGDFYAGLTRNFRNTQAWKKLRITKHDHHPVNDAMGNREALQQIFQTHNIT